MKETTYQEKIPLVEPWMEEIIDSVKRDLKTEHFKKDRTFCNRYFMGRQMNQVPNKELGQAYIQDIQEGNIALAEFIATRWLLKHTDIYGFFEMEFKKITNDFESLKTLDPALAQQLKSDAVKKFGATRTFLFSLFNCVVFSDEVYQELREAALQEKGMQKEEEKILDDEKMKERYERKIAALTDRYEKKLSGFQKKYLQDTEMLKKQLRALKEDKEKQKA